MYIRVRVQASSRKEHVIKKTEDHFDISVKEPAEQNRANKRVIEIIAQEYGVRTNQIRIISGHHTPGKIFDVQTEPHRVS